MVSIGNLPSIALLLFAQSERGERAFATVNTAERLVSFAGSVAGLAFTLLGILTAVLALFISLGETRSLRWYKQRRYLTALQVLIVCALLELSVAFALSMSLFFGTVGTGRIVATVFTAGGGVGLTLIATFTVLMVQHQSQRDK